MAAKTPAEEYYDKYGYDPWGPEGSEQRKEWEALNEFNQEEIKQKSPFYQGMSEEQRGIFDDMMASIEAGSPVDTAQIEQMAEAGMMSPAARNWFYKNVPDMLTGANVPGVGKLFRKGKGALDVALKGQVQDIYSDAARRGVLTSSSTAAGVGGAIGGYSGSLADLMNYAMTMRETMKQGEYGRGMGLANLGMGWQQQDLQNQMGIADMLNNLYQQNIQNQGGALDYLTQQQMMENQFNMEAGNQWGWDPMTGGDVIFPAIGAGLSAWQAINTGAGGGA